MMHFQANQPCMVALEIKLEEFLILILPLDPKEKAEY